ncbi:MAG: sensor histidine kinase, partial [Isosphaeraceae bacterium]|nr:sensor histidine kinase [Isosphaeraceae bacterium]
MGRTIRNQILIPLIAIQGVAVAAITAATAGLAAARSERQIIERLNGVIDSLGHANFPYTANVLGQMRGLSGAHFVALDTEGRVTATSFPAGDDHGGALHAVPLAAHLDSLGVSPVVLHNGTRYFAVRLGAPSRPRGSSLVVLYAESSWRQARREAALPPLMLGAGSLALTAVVAGWIAHRIGARIRRVERQVASIAEGDFREIDLGRERDEVYD